MKRLDPGAVVLTPQNPTPMFGRGVRPSGQRSRLLQPAQSRPTNPASDSELSVQTTDPAISDRSFREEALESLRSYLAAGDSGAGDASTDALTVDEQVNLFEAGVLDSLHLVGMIGFIESEFECSLDYDELTEENLGTLAAILAMIERKRVASS